MILRNGMIRTLDPSLPTVAALCDRGRPHRGRRRRPRDRAAEPRDRRPRRPLRPPRLHRLARPLPDLGARAAGGATRRLRLARGGARPCSQAPARRRVAARSRLARRRLAGRPPTSQRALDEVVSDRPAMLISKDYHGALAQLDGARDGGRRPRGRGRSRRSATRRASRPACCTRSRRGSSRGATS